MSGEVAELRELVEREFRHGIKGETVLALLDVAEAAKEHYESWNQDYGSYEEGQRIVRANENLREALARLEALTGGTHADR